MSANLSSPDTINALATYWERSPSQPGSLTTPATSLDKAWIFSCNARGDRAPDQQVQSTIQNMHPFEAVFALLLLENQRSLAARYPSPSDADMYDAPSSYYRAQRLPIVDYWIGGRITGQMVGLVRGYVYQVCEHEDWTTSVAYFLIEQIEYSLLEDLEARDCGQEGNWANFEAPEDPREVAMRKILAGGKGLFEHFARLDP